MLLFHLVSDVHGCNINLFRLYMYVVHSKPNILKYNIRTDTNTTDSSLLSYNQLLQFDIFFFSVLSRHVVVAYTVASFVTLLFRQLR